MIKNILIPEKIGNYYLFSQNFIGIDIGKTAINLAKITVSGTAITIGKCWYESIESNKKPYDERVIQALKKIKKTLPKTGIKSAISSSHVVFKTLKLPFLNHDKIKMVLKFEVEPLLPFSIQDAVIDFIITKQYAEQKTSEILVAAIQQKYIAEHLALFQAADIDPEIITVDMFALYGLYTQIPSYQNHKGISILMDLGIQSTRIAAINNHHLNMIRSLPQGLFSVAKDMSKSIEESSQHAIEQIMRFGLTHSDPLFQKTLKDALTSFLNKIQFALGSLANSQEINRILILGTGSEINGIVRLITDQLGITCEQFDTAKLIENKDYTIKSAHTINPLSVMSIATAIPTPITQDFNLRVDEFAPKDESLLLKQVITAIVLIVTIIGSITIHLYRQKKALEKEIRLSQGETLEMLNERFPTLAEDEDDLEVIMDAAQTELKQEEEMWYAFTRQSRTSFLEYLLELTSRINKQELGFIPESITIVDGQEGSITLKARVRDFEALKKLEQALRESKLFTFVEGQTSPDFSMKILVGKREDS